MLWCGIDETVFAKLFCGSLFCFLLFGCDKPAVPKPDSSSGIRGVCFLPKEPPDQIGKPLDRKPWVGVEAGLPHYELVSGQRVTENRVS